MGGEIATDRPTIRQSGAENAENRGLRRVSLAFMALASAP